MLRVVLRPVCCTVLVLLAGVFMVYAGTEDDQKKENMLKVLAALSRGSDAIKSGHFREAVDVLESHLALIGNNREYLDALRNAYLGLLQDLSQKNQPGEVERYQRRLQAIDPGALLEIKGAGNPRPQETLAAPPTQTGVPGAPTQAAPAPAPVSQTTQSGPDARPQSARGRAGSHCWREGQRPLQRRQQRPLPAGPCPAETGRSGLSERQQVRGRLPAVRPGLPARPAGRLVPEILADAGSQGASGILQATCRCDRLEREKAGQAGSGDESAKSARPCRWLPAGSSISSARISWSGFRQRLLHRPGLFEARKHLQSSSSICRVRSRAGRFARRPTSGFSTNGPPSRWSAWPELRSRPGRPRPANGSARPPQLEPALRPVLVPDQARLQPGHPKADRLSRPRHPGNGQGKRPRAVAPDRSAL